METLDLFVEDCQLVEVSLGSKQRGLELFMILSQVLQYRQLLIRFGVKDKSKKVNQVCSKRQRSWKLTNQICSKR